MKYICGCYQDPTETHSERERKRRQNGMNWKPGGGGVNKRPDGLSKSVAVRNVKGGSGDAGKEEWEAAKQQEIGPSYRLQKCGGRKWEEKEQERRDDSLLMRGGGGKVGQVWERREGVSSPRSSSSVSVPHEPLPLFSEQKKVVVKSESAPAA